MNTSRPERHFHLPASIARPEGLATRAAGLLEAAVRQALADAVRAAGGHLAEDPSAPAAHGGSRAVEEETSGDGERDGGADGYRVPSYDAAGRPVTVRLRRAPRWGTAGPAGGLGTWKGSGTGGAGLGGAVGATPALRSAAEAPAAPERPWTPERLAALRTRMGHDHRQALLGRIDADSLVTGGRSVRLVPALGEGADRERTVAARLGAGAFYLESITRERVGLVAATESTGSGGYLVHRVTDDGRRHDTGLRVITRDTAPVPAGILAYTGDLTTIREVRIVGRRPRDPRAVAAAIAGVLHHLTGAPGSVAAATLKGYLRDLDDDEVMLCFAELDRLGRLRETMTLVRVRAVRDYFRERNVPWSYVFGNWEPNGPDAAAVFSGVLWGAGQSVTDVFETIGLLFGSSDVRQEIWKAAVTTVQHPLIAGQEALRALRDTFWEHLERLEFFDAGRFLGQLVVAALTLPEAVRALPRLATSAVRVVAGFNRIGVAVLDRIGLGLRDVIRFLLTEQHALVTDTGAVLMMSGDDVLVSGAKVTGTSAISHGEILQAIKQSDAPRFFTDAEVDAWLKETEGLLKEPAVKPGAATGAAEAAEAVLTIDALEGLVAAALAELGELPGSADMSNSVRGTRLHAIFSRLVQEQFPHSGLTLVSETSLRAFAKLPAEILDMPIEEYVARTPGLMAYERELRPLFMNTETGETRLIGNLKPDLVVRAPGELVVFDLTSVEVGKHLAKDLLYTYLLGESGDIARVGETYWRHMGRTTAEIQELYKRATRAYRKRTELARRLKALHDAKKGTTP
ncbi:hypothetical protein [Streptomyces sp. NPDC004267]|uniref:hypothetical protein n=1 Tax=Streptomyces sp. NPDC004267 TaxID=3364694 RepID=UPI00369740BE